MTDVPTATPQPAAPPVEAAAPVGEPTAAPQPQADPRLAHLLQHYMPEGVDVATELMHVVQGVDAEGQPSFHYRPLVPAPAPAVDTPPTDAAAPVSSPVTAAPPLPPAPPPPAPAPVTPVAGPPAVPGYGQQTVVAPAPTPPAQPFDVNNSSDEDFMAWYDGMLSVEPEQAPVRLA